MSRSCYLFLMLAKKSHKSHGTVPFIIGNCGICMRFKMEALVSSVAFPSYTYVMQLLLQYINVYVISALLIKHTKVHFICNRVLINCVPEVIVRIDNCEKSVHPVPRNRKEFFYHVQFHQSQI